MPIPGAVPDETGTSFTVWAEGRQTVTVEIEGHGETALMPQSDGYFHAHVAGVRPGARYGFRVDNGPVLPDPASRCQPDGNAGWSAVQSSAYAWTDENWRGPGHFDHLIYELNVGTFTGNGTWDAATRRLEHLHELGVSIIHLMPVATFEGAFGWGYDTTLPYAPFAPYGTPDEMRAFIDRAHALGLGVILDVVYNHVGMGGHFEAYSSHYLTDRHVTEWGKSFNFDGVSSGPVRDFISGNAAYWVRDFHIDGLRLDATQALIDDSDTHIIAEIVSAARAAAGHRSIYVLGENQPQDRRLVERPADGGYGLDALASDDFQHAARVAVTGHNDFYYRDYLGTPQELVSALKHGFLYQGQRSDMRNTVYGTDNLDTPADRVVHFLENHDQVANSAQGLRLSRLIAPERLRAITALLLLGPQTPCLFQGQEFGSTRAFSYFLGVTGDAARAVADGRRESLSNFSSVTDPEMSVRLPDPSAPDTFLASKLDWPELDRNRGVLALHRDLIALRRADRAFSQRHRRRIDGAVISDSALLIRYLTETSADQRLLLLNLGRDLNIGVVAEPLLAPPGGQKWVLQWSSEHPDYGGAGRRAFDTDKFSVLPGNTAILLRPEVRG
ncbi:MAG: alpha-amylase family glycosyl hydrolase [Candidatus Devosia phytovorans]|uniref:Malto-oligosyltrehalose trehalohydrolase n=1 Tax=Candidatus Devosia phytovorans TaxID=3121372 RepID=A0AAJ5VUF3_9HYPH|nr:alpha-amylase family glycosyl hydrolase [Devosia sp.]WEK04375.1 MAG: alpha-amylase family glycosyl hydrolase [Devosia sp.]